MATLLETCPECSRALELPADSVGRLAKCPACEATFRIGQIEPSGSVSDGRLQIIQVAIEDLLSPTITIFKRDWLPSVGSCLIITVAGAILIGLPAWVLSMMSGANQQLYAVIGVMLLIPYSIMLSAYALVGLCRVHLAIARGEPEPLSELLPSTEQVLRFLPSYTLLFLLVAFVFGVGIGAVVITATAANAQLANFVGVIVAFVLMVAVTVLQWYLWAWMMASSDGKCTVLGSMKVASSITLQNKLCSFFIVIIAVVLSLVGSLTCYVGHIVTSPLTLLLFAVGYLLTTNQAVAAASESAD